MKHPSGKHQGAEQSNADAWDQGECSMKLPARQF
jgi:hypothetical protein